MKVCYGIDLNGEDSVIVRAERLRGRNVYTRVKSSSDIENGAYCSGFMAARSSFTRWLEAPITAPGKAFRIFPSILDIHLPFPLEECVYEFVNYRKTVAGSHVLAVGARFSDVEDRLNVYQKSGYDIQVLDHEGTALWRQSLREDAVLSAAGKPRVLVWLNGDRSTMVLGRGSDFISSHGIREDDTGRIRQLLEAGFGPDRGMGVSWFFSGKGSAVPNAASVFTGRAGEEWKGPSKVHNEPEMFLARALAANLIEQGKPVCNLRKGKLAHSAVVRRERLELLKPVLVSMAAGLILAGASLSVSSILQRREAVMDSDFANLASELAGYRVTGKGKHALLAVEKILTERANKMRPFVSAFGESLTGVIAGIMEVGKQNNLKYEVVSIAGMDNDILSETGGQDDGGVLIKGTAVEWNACDSLVVYLKSHGYPVVLTRKEALADDRIPFTIKSGGTK